MNDIDVTQVSRTAGSGKASSIQRDIALADSDRVAHERIANTVRWLLNHTDVTQRELASLLECDVSSVNRALLVKENPNSRARRRDWRAREVYRLALFFDLPIEVFYGTNVEAEWRKRMAAAQSEHDAALRSMDANDG